MICTTTDTIAGQMIIRYLDIVSGTDNYSFAGAFGVGSTPSDGNSRHQKALSNAKAAMVRQAASLGATAVIGVSVDTSLSSLSGGRAQVVMSGTAVLAAPKGSAATSKDVKDGRAKFFCSKCGQQFTIPVGKGTVVADCPTCQNRLLVKT